VHIFALIDISTLFLNGSMKPVLRDETVLRVQETVDAPISRGMDAAINKCLDELEALKAEQNGHPTVRSCNRMEELTNV